MKGTIVSLEQCSGGDYERLAKWFSNETSWYAIGRPKLFSPEDLKNENLHGATTFLMVVENSGKRRVGAVSYTRKDEYAGSYVVGTGVGDKEQFNRGYGLESTMLLLNYLFRALNAHRVEFLVGLFNKHVITGVLGMGVVVEGVLRDHFFLDGEYHDAALCSVLRDEFEEFRLTSGVADMFDAVPRAEKEEARVLAREHLAGMRDRHLAELFDRPRARSSETRPDVGQVN
ncbi:GNAT family N-acetyltransferase [Actinomadura fibrosa]|uniref:GNAT family N-acetyltransferase n=1 Tax=Actinomadura fibrosa TaxID=111802 RepID=A0ABW2XK72_9ACTN|nr:GNAT family protein [Actinomadura fibrosa]